jgi:hypothetical protein
MKADLTFVFGVKAVPRIIIESLISYVELIRYDHLLCFLSKIVFRN